MDSTATSNPVSPVSPASILFARGVIARLAYWPALRIAVDQAWGGPESAEKRTWFASVIVDAFEEQDPSPDDQYVEEMLLQMMEDEFSANLEDGSAENVAKDVVRLWEDIHVGKQDLVVLFEQQAERLKGKTLQVQEEVGSGSESEDDEDGEEDESDEAPQLTDQGHGPTKQEPQIDEDGFTLVQGKGKGRR